MILKDSGSKIILGGLYLTFFCFIISNHVCHLLNLGEFGLFCVLYSFSSVMLFVGFLVLLFSQNKALGKMFVFGGAINAVMWTFFLLVKGYNTYFYIRDQII